jgi:superfamily I DNA/RNA helicase
MPLVSQSLIAKLNPEQRAAVEATEGPLLILAGAGSGKTRVITSRIAWLIQEKGVAPDAILAVTFTNKAAAEMAERVERLLGHATVTKPLISTFHSLCVRILRRDIEALRVNNEGLTRSFAIFDENDQAALVKQIMRRMGLDIKQLTPRTVLSRISWAKNHMVDPQDYYLGSRDPNGERIAHIYQSYKAELRKNNAMDFDDLLLEAVRLLKVSASTRERYERRFRYVLVDEYQDTNRPQYELMKMLAGEHKNVCAVGDEDQSIYSWRGADIRNILEFEKDFPNARIVRLEQNYRSTQNILEAAGAVVANNLRRKGKKLWTDRQGGSLIGYYEAPDGENEALFIADRIQKFLRQAGESGEEAHCAVLYRTNSQSRLVEEALRRYGVKYSMVGGFSFYERAEIKDLMSYLRLVQNPHDSMALNRVINTPVRGIGKTTLESIERLALETGSSTWDALGASINNKLISTRALMALDSFRQLILDAQAMMDPDFAGKLSADVAESDAGLGDAGFAFGASAPSDEDNQKVVEALEQAAEIDFNFGGNADQLSLLDPASFNPFAEAPKRPFLKMPKQTFRPAHASAERDSEGFAIGSNLGQSNSENLTPNTEAAKLPRTVEVTIGDVTRLILESDYEKLRERLDLLEERAGKIGASSPRVEIKEEERLKVAIFFDPIHASGWELIGVIKRIEGRYSIEKVSPEPIPDRFLDDPEHCEHCQTRRHRNETFVLRSGNGELKQVGSSCIHEFLGDKPEVRRFANSEFRQFNLEAANDLTAYLREMPEFIEEAFRTRERAKSSRFWATSFDRPLMLPEADSAFRKPGDPATLPELIRFIIDRTGYIKTLETEGTPEAFSRIENLKELANAAHDAEVRGESLADFLDHAALASDADQYDPTARVTLMTLHAAKGLEFPLVFLAGMEEGLFPHSRTLQNPEELEEERRLCYVGMTRAMNTLILTRANFRRRYGNDAPEMSIPSRFLEEVPQQLIENLGATRAPAWAYSGSHGSRYQAGRRQNAGDGYESRHYNYEDESQETPAVSRTRAGSSRTESSKPFVAPWMTQAKPKNGQGTEPPAKTAGTPREEPDSIDNIARFFGGKAGPVKPGSLARPAMDIPKPSGATGLKKGDRVRHSKYGEGSVLMREGDGEDAKITVMFQRHGMKKLMEKFANLEKI